MALKLLLVCSSVSSSDVAAVVLCLQLLLTLTLTLADDLLVTPPHVVLNHAGLDCRGTTRKAKVDDEQVMSPKRLRRALDVNLIPIFFYLIFKIN